MQTPEQLLQGLSVTLQHLGWRKTASGVYRFRCPYCQHDSHAPGYVPARGISILRKDLQVDLALSAIALSGMAKCDLAGLHCCEIVGACSSPAAALSRGLRGFALTRGC